MTRHVRSTTALRFGLALFCGLALTFGLGSTACAQAGSSATETPFGIFNAVEIAPQVISSGQPTAEQLKALGAAGYKSVIDLRATSEDRGFDEAGLAKSLGLAYENIPITLDLLDAAAVERFRAAFKNAPRPLLLHCASANRTGALFYTYLVMDEKVAPEEALAKAHAAGLKNPGLEERVKALASSAAN